MPKLSFRPLLAHFWIYYPLFGFSGDNLTLAIAFLSVRLSERFSLLMLTNQKVVLDGAVVKDLTVSIFPPTDELSVSQYRQ